MRNLTICFCWLRGFHRDRSGVAAVEFAIFSPILIGASLVMFGLGTAAFDKMKLTSGIRSASQFVLTGGEDTTVMKQLVIDGSGLNITADNVTISSYCGCTINSDPSADVCNVLCTDEAPRVYKTITATVPDTGYNLSFFGIFDVTIADTSATAEVRTR